MVVDVAVSSKEVLAWLIRASQLAEKALKNLNSGNPYDAVRLIKVIAKADANALNIITRVPNYETHVKQAHLELISECRAILALSQAALQTVSPELQNLPPERLAKAQAIFQEALSELDKELKAEMDVQKALSEARKAFLQQTKAWTYSRSHLEHALETLDSLVQDQVAIKQTVDRFSKVFRGVKHQNPNQFLQDLLKRRLQVRAAAKYVHDNAFKNAFDFEFNKRTWLSTINNVSHLPEENIRELNALKEQLLQSTIFAKRNVSYQKLSQLINRLAGLSKHARLVERAIEIAEEAAKERGKSEEEALKDFWEKHIHNGFVYHGTSSIFLPNIERFGLSSEQIFSEGTPFRPEDYTFFLQISRKAYGADAPHLEYFTQDVTRGFFLDTNHGFAINYAKQGPERIRFMMEHIRGMEEEFRQGKFAGKVSQQEIYRLLQILGQYEQAMSRHKPVVLHIPLSSPALLTVLRQNSEMGALAASIISDFGNFKKYVQQEFSSFMTSARQQGWTEFSDWNILKHAQKENPLERFFHNRPLKGTIQRAGIAKVEYV